MSRVSGGGRRLVGGITVLFDSCCVFRWHLAALSLPMVHPRKYFT